MNSRLLQQIELACDRYERKEIDEPHLFSSLEANINALEGLSNELALTIIGSFQKIADAHKENERELILEQLRLLKSALSRLGNTG